jgi:uncharacterized membrane protein
VISPTLETLRLFLHVLAATVWVGGQLTLAGLVPGLRALGDDVPRTVARRFNRIAWPAFVVLVGTGLWNLSEGTFEGRRATTLAVKIAVVVVSGASAALHGRRNVSRFGLAVWGALAGVSALAALWFGVQLRG